MKFHFNRFDGIFYSADLRYTAHRGRNVYHIYFLGNYMKTVKKLKEA